jgi:predicted ArsR family transcriptional regulator
MSRTKPKRDDSSGRFAYEGLERLLHERARLSILTSLVSQPEGIVFNDLKELCSLTDGNLSRHLQVLQDAEIVEVWKGTRANRPQTLYRIAEQGRRRFLEYISVLESVVSDAVSGAREPAVAKGIVKGWLPL